MTRVYVDDFFHVLIRDIVSERRDSPLLTISWIAEQALRVVRNPTRREAALREGAEAMARDVLLSSNPARYRVSRDEEFQYVLPEHLTDGELIDLVARLRHESVVSAEEALRLQIMLAARTAPDVALEHEHEPDCPAIDGFGCRCGEEVMH